MEGRREKSHNKSSSLSVDQFVSVMTPLIDLEKEAEISASLGSSSSKSLDIAQKKGSAILNLKCTDAQTGLMGKVLLEFQSNKGDVLLAHKNQEVQLCFGGYESAWADKDHSGRRKGPEFVF